MSGGQEPKSVFGRNDVRAVIAIGYVALFALCFGRAASTPLVHASAQRRANTQVAVAAKSGAMPSKAAPCCTDKDAAAAIAALAKISDYQTARWHPLHFKPAIDTATNEQCLACHKEVLDHKPRDTSPAGVTAAQSVAWYQTLDTYEGEQASFHARHISTPFAKTVMNLKCNFCHQGNDPREEAQRRKCDVGQCGVTTAQDGRPLENLSDVPRQVPWQSHGF